MFWDDTQIVQFEFVPCVSACGRLNLWDLSGAPEQDSYWWEIVVKEAGGVRPRYRLILWLLLRCSRSSHLPVSKWGTEGINGFA